MAKTKALPIFRLFGSCRYAFDAGFASKSAAKARAAKLRKRGLLLVLLPEQMLLAEKGYVVYWSRK